MKLLTTTLLLIICFCLQIAAQAPQGFSYQAIANNSNGTPVANKNVAVRISLLDNSASGTLIYKETHQKTTNAQGLYNLNIGQGTSSFGNFSGIDWGQNSKYIKVEIDTTGGSNFVTVGTNQLMSVPYALYAGTVDAGNLANTIATISSGGTGKAIVVYTTSNAYAFYQNNGSGSNWTSTNLSGTPVGAIAATDMVMIYTATDAYTFHQNGGSGGAWSSATISGTPIKAIAANHCIVLYTTSDAYAFYQNGGTGGSWTSTSISGTPLGATSSSDNVVIYTTSYAYSFYQNSGTYGSWSGTSLSGTPAGIINDK